MRHAREETKSSSGHKSQPLIDKAKCLLGRGLPFLTRDSHRLQGTREGFFWSRSGHGCDMCQRGLGGVIAGGPGGEPADERRDQQKHQCFTAEVPRQDRGPDP